MTIQECYEAMGGDYKGVMARLLKEDRVAHFLGKFKNDSMLEPLEASLAAKNYEDAFRAAHNLKGVCQNLGIIKLADSSSELCELVRNGEPAEDITPYLEAVREDFSVTIKALEQALQ